MAEMVHPDDERHCAQRSSSMNRLRKISKAVGLGNILGTSQSRCASTVVPPTRSHSSLFGKSSVSSSMRSWRSKKSRTDSVGEQYNNGFVPEDLDIAEKEKVSSTETGIMSHGQVQPEAETVEIKGQRSASVSVVQLPQSVDRMEAANLRQVWRKRGSAAAIDMSYLDVVSFPIIEDLSSDEPPDLERSSDAH
ncbi:unnamed protein product [Soboliphyme baturini]|uniref:RING/FYVE/PHD zinc finger superfamily protein n=1 Tax=Soboliphyme baturini TaxID=241478 RepID=A0A183J1Q0_9BILA|nr:unnamed protein product [Soboliphyme baturini]